MPSSTVPLSAPARTIRRIYLCPTALEIQPLALACAQFSCSYGYYSLATTTRANPEIQITGRIGDPRTNPLDQAEQA